MCNLTQPQEFITQPIQDMCSNVKRVRVCMSVGAQLDIAYWGRVRVKAQRRRREGQQPHSEEELSSHQQGRFSERSRKMQDSEESR